MLVIQIPQVQTAIAEKVVGMISEQIEGNISFEKIHFKPFNTLVLKNVVITDKNPAIDPHDPARPGIDTLARIEYLVAKLSLAGLLDEESIKIKEVCVTNGQFNLVLEDHIDPDGKITIGNNIARMFGLYNPQKKEPINKEIFNIKDVKITNMGFSMFNYGTKKLPFYGGINWNNLVITDIDLLAHNLRFKNGTMYGDAEKLTFKESTGFECHKLSASTRVGPGKAIIRDIHLIDEWSDVHVPVFMMSYNSIESFKNFNHEVKLDGTASHSTVNFRTLAYFAPQIEDAKIIVDGSGTMSGYVDDFELKDVVFSSHAGGFSGRANGRIVGAPEVLDMRIYADVTDIAITPEGLGKFASEWMNGKRLDLSGIGKGLVFRGRATASGLIDRMQASADLKSSSGSLSAKVNFKNLLRYPQPVLMNGSVTTKDLDLGRILETDIFGPVSAHSEISMDIQEDVTVDMNSLKVDRLNILKYDYKDIFAKGNYTTNSVNGTVICHDPNLNFIFQGGYARSEKSQNTVYKFTANVGHADLHAVNLDRRGKSIVQCKTNTDITTTSRGDIIGRVDIGNVLLENKAGRYDIGDIIFTSYSNDNTYEAKLNSSFANAAFTGTGSLVDFAKDLIGITVKRELPSLTDNPEYTLKGNTYNIELMCHDLQNVLAFAVPGMYVENGTSFTTSIQKDGTLHSKLSSKRIAFKRNYMKDISINVNNENESLQGDISCEEISAATIMMKDNLLQLHANNDIFGAGFSFNNHSEPESKGEIVLNGKLSKEEDATIYDIKIRPSSLQYNSKEWNIQPSNIRIHDGTIEVDSFGAISGEQTISFHGRASEDIGDVLNLNLERFDISFINSLLKDDWRFNGAVTGTAQITSPLSDVQITADAIWDSAHIADIPLGIVQAQMEWDDVQENFLIELSNNLNGKQNMTAYGTYRPKGKYLNAFAKLDNADIGYGQPFFKEVFDEVSGRVSGEIYANGPIDRLKLQSKNARIDNAIMKILYTGVPYYANGPFHVDDTGIYFDEISINDRYGGKGKVSGSINYQHFKDISFDTHINVEEIEALSLTEKEGEMYYGNVFGTGKINITGPSKKILIDIDATTTKTGQLHIPTDFSLTSSTGTNLLKFKTLDTLKFIDPYDIFVQRTVKEEQAPTDFIMRMNLNATPGVEAFVEIDKANGNVLSGRGNGNIKLEVGSDLFDIDGDYTLTDGNYKFVAMGLVSRDFHIQNGSSIRFGGDIWDSVLDIDALYKTKASIATLISDTSSVSNRRVVECGINIKDKLSNPQLTFSIEIPDLDPTIKSRVESALSTQDKVQKQFLSLILSNNFLPDEQSGIVNNSSVLYSNVSEMMSNQINNIFQKLNIPLDLGLKYQPNERGNDIFDVAVSTQLFNNRVVVNGNIGNKQYSTGNTQNDVVGDIDIEIKLNRSGSFRLNLFSHSADQYTNYLDNSQRNGVGITYQTEFNTFKEFFRNLFIRRKKRMESMEAATEVPVKNVTINIDKPQGKKNGKR